MDTTTSLPLRLGLHGKLLPKTDSAIQSPISPIPESITLDNFLHPTHSSQSLSPKSSRDSFVTNDSFELVPSSQTSVSSVPEFADKVEVQPRRASTSLLSQDGQQLRKILGSSETGTTLIRKYCCGGGCCFTSNPDANATITPNENPIPTPPNNPAFASLGIDLKPLALDSHLTSTTPLPECTITLAPVDNSASTPHTSGYILQPPSFVQPHPPYHVFAAPLFHARELTKPGAEKRTFHFDIDVTDYPDEGGVDFKVGGAIGICPPNHDNIVLDIMDCLGIPKFLRDKPVLMSTVGGRWPTIWGDEQARQLRTTRREILTWCCDLQSSPPTKSLLRIMAEYASDPCEAKILTYLVSAEGQGAFCDLRTGPHLTLCQLLHAFPSSQPPLEHLLSVMKQLMPRFYSLSNDPCVSRERNGSAGRRLIEIAVSVHETADWKTGTRTGVGSGYLERLAHQFMEFEAQTNSSDLSTHLPSFPLKIPIFRGLMANPLTREFTSDGPMLLIGAGVGMAPFRGYILNRLKNANCANKIWLLQGVRDASVDALYQGELGDHEHQVKRLVQSRKKDRMEGEARYVQEEVMHQADIVWSVIKSVDGRVCVCGSSKGMGEGVWDALVRVGMQKGRMNRDESERFWDSKKESGQYIAELW